MANFYAEYPIKGGSGSAVTSIGPFGSSPNDNGGVISSNVLTLEPADGTHPGGVSTTTQSFAGLKTFTANSITIAPQGFQIGTALSILGAGYDAQDLAFNIPDGVTERNFYWATAGDDPVMLLDRGRNLSIGGDAFYFGDIDSSGTTIKAAVVGIDGSGGMSLITIGAHPITLSPNSTPGLSVLPTGVVSLNAAPFLLGSAFEVVGNTYPTTDLVIQVPLNHEFYIADATTGIIADINTAGLVLYGGHIAIGAHAGSPPFPPGGGYDTAYVDLGAPNPNVLNIADASQAAVPGSGILMNLQGAETFGLALADYSSGNGVILKVPSGLTGFYNFNLPATAGTAGQVLTSQGGSSTAMTWTTPATTVTNADHILTTAVSTNASYFPLFVSSSSNGYQSVDLGTGLTFNPSTNTFTTANLVGSTKLTTPIMVTGSANPATAGAIQFGNQDLIAWGVPGGSTNMTLGIDVGNNGLHITKAGLFTDDDFTYNYPTIGLGHIPTGGNGIYVNFSNMTGSSQTGVFCHPTGNTSATSYTTAFWANPGTINQAFTCSVISGFLADDLGKGAGSTITRAIKFYALNGAPTTGTHNALFADNESFTGSWGFNVASTNANTFGGSITAPTFIGAVTGTATNATNVATTATNSTNASFFPTFVASSSSGNQGVDTATGLTFNPSTNTLATTTFSGALSGNATTATTAANLSGTNLTGDVTNSANATTVANIGGGTVVGSTTYTPNYNASGSSGITYSSRNGRYTVIGKQVTFSADVSLSGGTLGTGVVSIDLPPFSVGNGPQVMFCTLVANSTGLSLGNVPMAIAGPGQQAATILYSTASGTNNFLGSNATSSAEFIVSGSYVRA